MKHVAALVLVGMLCTSCIIQPVTYDPAGEETRVAAAVKATLAVAAAGEPSTTAPPPPTATPAPPTPTPLPTPISEVIHLPTDWTQCTTDDGAFTFWRPSSWRIEATEQGIATFTDINSFFSITVAWDDLCNAAGGTEEIGTLDCLTDSLLEAFRGTGGPDIQILRKEERRFGERGGYVLEFNVQYQQVRSHALVVWVTLDPGILVAVAGVARDQQDLEYLELVAASAEIARLPKYGFLELSDASDSDGAGRAAGDFCVTEWSWDLSRSGAHIVVDGRIENSTERPIKDVQVLVAMYDGDHRLLRADTCYADLPLLGPGRRTPFRLITPNPGGVEHVLIVGLEAQWAD